MRAIRSGAVRSRVDADHGVAAAVGETFEHRRQDAARIVRGVVGLQPHRHRARQPDGVAETRHDPHLARDRDQILVAHQLATRRRHLGREAGRQLGKARRGREVRQQPVAEVADGQRCATGAKAAASWLSMMRRVTSSSS